MCSPEVIAGAVALAVLSGADWERTAREYVRARLGLDADDDAESDGTAPARGGGTDGP
jgi:hypothetical protein